MNNDQIAQAARAALDAGHPPEIVFTAHWNTRFTEDRHPRLEDLDPATADAADQENNGNRAALAKLMGHQILGITEREAAELKKKYLPQTTFQPEQATQPEQLNLGTPTPETPRSNPVPRAFQPVPNATFPVPTPETPVPADHSPLDDISPANQQVILELLDHGLSLRAVARRISYDPPHGLGIPTSHSSVLRFRDRHRTRQAALDTAAAASAAAKLNAEAAAFIPATTRLLHAHLFRAALEPELPLDQLSRITVNLVRLHRANLAGPKLAQLEQTQNPT